MPTKRSVQVTITCADKGEVELKVKELEAIKADDGSEFHSESECAKQSFAVFGSAVSAAVAQIQAFEKKVATRADGELFA